MQKFTTYGLALVLASLAIGCTCEELCPCGPDGDEYGDGTGTEGLEPPDETGTDTGIGDPPSGAMLVIDAEDRVVGIWVQSDPALIDTEDLFADVGEEALLLGTMEKHLGHATFWLEEGGHTSGDKVAQDPTYVYYPEDECEGTAYIRATPEDRYMSISECADQDAEWVDYWDETISGSQIYMFEVSPEGPLYGMTSLVEGTFREYNSQEMEDSTCVQSFDLNTVYEDCGVAAQKSALLRNYTPPFTLAFF